MLRETCPDDFDDLPPPRRSRQPSPLLVFIPAFLVLVGVVLVGALHAALDYPLGEAWAAEVWGLARTMIFPTLVAASFGVYVSRQGEAPSPHMLPGDRRPPGLRSGGGSATGGHRVVQLQQGDMHEEDDR